MKLGEALIRSSAAATRSAPHWHSVFTKLVREELAPPWHVSGLPPDTKKSLIFFHVDPYPGSYLGRTCMYFDAHISKYKLTIADKYKHYDKMDPACEQDYEQERLRLKEELYKLLSKEIEVDITEPWT